MRKLFLLLILIILLNGCINQNIKEPYKPPICGDNICEPSEEEYCLDCNSECKSDLCNEKINIICDNCTETQKKLLPTFFRNQLTAYYCLVNYFNYHPARLIYHIITTPQVKLEQCNKREGCYISGIGYGGRSTIKQGMIPGLINYNEYEVTKPENIGIEIHELTHCFTDNAFGYDLPSWFNEGISIYTESRVQCPNHITTDRIGNIMVSYEKLKQGVVSLNEVAPYDNYYKIKHNSHVVGSIFFGALEQDYNCNKDCISKILFNLYRYRENCNETCFKIAKNKIPQLANISLNNNDLRVPILTNKIIKQKAEEVIGKDLSYLFNLLEINY